MYEKNPYDKDALTRCLLFRRALVRVRRPLTSRAPREGVREGGGRKNENVRHYTRGPYDVLGCERGCRKNENVRHDTRGMYKMFRAQTMVLPLRTAAVQCHLLSATFRTLRFPPSPTLRSFTGPTPGQATTLTPRTLRSTGPLSNPMVPTPILQETRPILQKMVKIWTIRLMRWRGSLLKLLGASSSWPSSTVESADRYA